MSIEPVVTGYEEAGQEYWWVTICNNGKCHCVIVDQSTYPGCDATNFHYWEKCAPDSEPGNGKAPSLTFGGAVALIVLMLLIGIYAQKRKRLMRPKS
jgi:hypothetical protein